MPAAAKSCCVDSQVLEGSCCDGADWKSATQEYRKKRRFCTDRRSANHLLVEALDLMASEEGAFKLARVADLERDRPKANSPA